MHFNTETGTLYLCDAMTLLSAMLPESVDCLVTDPPYRVISGGMRVSNTQNGYATSIVKGIENGKVFAHNEITPEEWLPECFRVLKPGTHSYVMTNALNLERMLTAARTAGFHFSNLLIWEKNNVNANRYYMKNTEMTLFFQKKPARTINNPGSKQIFKADNPRDKKHPTEKPVELMRHYIENSTNPGQIVLDPFVGSGSTAIAAHQAGRRWIACEIDPMYYLTTLGRLSGSELK